MGYRISNALVVLAVISAAVVPAVADFRNPTDDPELAAAFRFDSEMTNGDEKLGDRAKAEAHYLRFIAALQDPAQRARAYVQIGVLYATNFNEAKGEKPDFAKSVAYMKKATAEEPDRVDRSMIRARTFLVTPDQSREEQFAQRIENYKWLTALTPDAVERGWLPVAGADAETQARSRAAFLNLLENLRDTEMRNLLSAAKSFEEEKAALERLVKALPGTPVETKAQGRLDELAAAATAP